MSLPQSVAEILDHHVTFQLECIDCFVCREPFQWEWTIIVRPVPRALKPRIGEKILQQALPLMRARLEAASPQSRRDGSYTLGFLFDELRDELVREEVA